jgi:hypothetical protein
MAAMLSEAGFRLINMAVDRADRNWLSFMVRRP